MFIYKYFKAGFNLPKLLSIRGEKLYKTLIYYILLIIIATFPLNYLTFQYEGSRLDFIVEDFSTSTPNWVLPADGYISGGQLHMTDDTVYTYTHENYTYIINDDSTAFDTSIQSIILRTYDIVYTDGAGNYLIADGYTGFTSDVFDFNTVNFMLEAEKEDAFMTFAESVESSFSDYIVLYTVGRNLLVQIGATFIYTIILAAIIQLFRFGFHEFLSFKDGLNFVIIAMTIPTILSVIAGLMLPGFSSVVFNLAEGMIVMFVLLLFARKNFT